jgi:hypothetical protein
MTMIDINLAFQSCEPIRTSTVHPILMLLGMYWQVQIVVGVLVSLDTESTRSTILTVQITDWFVDTINDFNVT